MIITRTADTVEFKLSETLSHRIDVSAISAVALSIGRRADGRLAPALEIQRASSFTERIEASLDCLTAMHARIVELMVEIAGPAAGGFLPDLSIAEPYTC